MLIVQSYALAVTMCFITMLCWGSWANTQKLASKEWRFQLFYWDYAIGVLLLALALAFTLGSSGSGGRPFLADLRQAEGKWLGSAFLGGVIFNLSNILLVAAIDIAGLAVAFPVGVGLALVLGVITTYLVNPTGNVPMLALGVGCIMIAILLDALAYRRLAGKERKTPVKGIVISVAAGLLMGWFYSFVAQSMGKIDPSTQSPGSGQTQSLHGHRRFLGRPAGIELPLEHDHDDLAAVGRSGAAGRLLHQGQRPAARHRHPGRGDLERRHELQHHRRQRGRCGPVVWPGPGGDHDRRLLGRVHLEGIRRRTVGHQQAPRGDVRLLPARAGNSDRIQALRMPALTTGCSG